MNCLAFCADVMISLVIQALLEVPLVSSVLDTFYYWEFIHICCWILVARIAFFHLGWDIMLKCAWFWMMKKNQSDSHWFYNMILTTSYFWQNHATSDYTCLWFGNLMLFADVCVILIDYLIHAFVMVMRHFHIIRMVLYDLNSFKFKSIHSFVFIVMCLWCDQNICYSWWVFPFDDLNHQDLWGPSHCY